MNDKLSQKCPRGGKHLWELEEVYCSSSRENVVFRRCRHCGIVHSPVYTAEELLENGIPPISWSRDSGKPMPTLDDWWAIVDAENEKRKTADG